MKIQIQTSTPQNGFKPILNPDAINTKAEFLTIGVFDLISSGSGGHSH
jgi:cobalt-zinc-cadmium efflux system membrane fusion protein